MDKIQFDYESGKSLVDISIEHEVSRKVITGILKERGVKLRINTLSTQMFYLNKNKKDIENGGKICVDCNQFKPIEEFRKIKRKGEYRIGAICEKCHIDRRNKRLYGLDPGMKEKLLEKQNYLCKICGKDIKDNAQIDHDHITGEVRGLLCSRCNMSVGIYETYGREVLDYLIQTKSRPDKDEWLMDIAKQVSRRSTCSRKKVGAILVREGRILSMGYNGAPSGIEHCEHDLDESIDKGCEISVHAEVNCFLWAARWGVKTDNSTLYTTLSPCISCSQMIINSGVQKVVIDELYRNTEGLNLLEDSGIEIVILGNWRNYD